VSGRDLKAEAVRAGVPLYQVAAVARINPVRLSRLVNDRAVLDSATEQRIRQAIEQLTPALQAR
jgi:hypothetical protein